MDAFVSFGINVEINDYGRLREQTCNVIYENASVFRSAIKWRQWVIFVRTSARRVLSDIDVETKTYRVTTYRVTDTGCCSKLET